MTAAKFIIRSLWKIKYYTLATFGLFALSRVFIYLDNYCIAALFGYVGTHPEQVFPLLPCPGLPSTPHSILAQTLPTVFAPF